MILDLHLVAFAFIFLVTIDAECAPTSNERQPSRSRGGTIRLFGVNIDTAAEVRQLTPPFEGGEGNSGGGGHVARDGSMAQTQQRPDRPFHRDQQGQSSRQTSRKGKEKMPVYEHAACEVGSRYTIAALASETPLTIPRSYVQREHEEDLHRQIEKRMAWYHFKVLDPRTHVATPVGMANGNRHGREHYLGHPDNAVEFLRNIHERWPAGTLLTESEAKRRSIAERNLLRSQQVVRYLQNHSNRGIYHAASGNIYLNQRGSEQDAYFQYIGREMPKLKYDTEGAIHFKMSDLAKFHRRHPASPYQPLGGGGGPAATRMSGRSIAEETSSEEEAEFNVGNPRGEGGGVGASTPSVAPSASRRSRPRRRSRATPDQQ